MNWFSKSGRPTGACAGRQCRTHVGSGGSRCAAGRRYRSRAGLGYGSLEHVSGGFILAVAAGNCAPGTVASAQGFAAARRPRERARARVVNGEPLHLLALGDSIIDGVGTATWKNPFPCSSPGPWPKNGALRVEWLIEGQTGNTLICDELPRAVDESYPADVILLSVGVNNVTGLTSTRSLAAKAGRVAGQPEQRLPEARIIFAGLPPMSRVSAAAAAVEVFAGPARNHPGPDRILTSLQGTRTPSCAHPHQPGRSWILRRRLPSIRRILHSMGQGTCFN